MARVSVVELARPEGSELRQGNFLDVSQQYDWPRCVEITNFVDYRESLQYVRLPADCTGKPSLKQIESYCEVANKSQSFYIGQSREQWLRTVITVEKSGRSRTPFHRKSTRKPVNPAIIHSNVIPRPLYLKSFCPNPGRCTRGFFLPADITNASSHYDLCGISCEHCALSNRLRSQDDVEPKAKLFLYLDDKEVVVKNWYGRGICAVSEVLWHGGVFVRKSFPCEGSNKHRFLLRELDVAMTASHPNLVHYFGCSGSSSAPEMHIFMEWLETDLYRFLLEDANDRLPLPFRFQDRLDVLLQIAQAMRHLHEKNFLHGDLKPHNIFVSRFESAHSGVQYYLVKVGDFGCAQRVQPALSDASTVESFDFKIGSAPYLAPEILKCRRIYSDIEKTEKSDRQKIEHLEIDLKRELQVVDPFKADVYSFGVLAYQVLTRVTVRHEDLPVRDIVCIDGTLDDGSSSLIKSCLASDPKDRPYFADICSDGLRGESGTLTAYFLKPFLPSDTQASTWRRQTCSESEKSIFVMSNKGTR